jgi:hypothetical protein
VANEVASWHFHTNPMSAGTALRTDRGLLDNIVETWFVDLAKIGGEVPRPGELGLSAGSFNIDGSQGYLEMSGRSQSIVADLKPAEH